MTQNQARLARVCKHYLRITRWAGELGDPVLHSHRAPADRRNVREIRHTRRVCHDVIAFAETLVWGEDRT